MKPHWVWLDADAFACHACDEIAEQPLPFCPACGNEMAREGDYVMALSASIPAGTSVHVTGRLNGGPFASRALVRA